MDPEHSALFVARRELLPEAGRTGRRPEHANLVRRSFVDLAAE
ncbi:hypothetical protein [Actinocorallia herbida]|nr:hypothetical protein [Actinocorallia herbida]